VKSKLPTATTATTTVTHSNTLPRVKAKESPAPSNPPSHRSHGQGYYYKYVKTAGKGSDQGQDKVATPTKVKVAESKPNAAGQPGGYYYYVHPEHGVKTVHQRRNSEPSPFVLDPHAIADNPAYVMAAEDAAPPCQCPDCLPSSGKPPTSTTFANGRRRPSSPLSASSYPGAVNHNGGGWIVIKDGAHKGDDAKGLEDLEV
jgi:hypothetical protein